MILTRRQCSNGKLLEITATMGPCCIRAESHSGARPCGSKLLAQGHDVQLMPPKMGQVRQERRQRRRACLHPTMWCVVLDIDEELLAEAKSDDACRRLLEVPGIDPQIATAVAAAIGNGRAFDRRRELEDWLGLTPPESSSGGRQRLGSISKRGNRYLCTLPLHWTRSSPDTPSRHLDGLGTWLRHMLASKPERNVAVVALATRLARVA